MLIIVLLALSLSIDALGIGLSYGFRNISTPLFTKCIIALESMIFMGIFIWIGNHMTLFFTAQKANNIGILILLFMGIWLFYQSFQKKQSNTSIEMLRNPCHCDKDHSSHIDAKEGLSLGLILSIDSMGVSIGAGASHISIIMLPLFTSIFQIKFLSIGIDMGKRFKYCCNIKENIWTAFSGCILISIAIIRFLY